MALTDLANLTPASVKKGPDCSVCQALRDLPPEESAALQQLLADKTWRYTQIAAAVRNDPDSPLDIHHATYARHAKGDCAARVKLR